MQDETLVIAAQKVAFSLGVEIGDSDIDIVHRGRSKDKDKPSITVKFAKWSAKDNVLSAVKTNSTERGSPWFRRNQAAVCNEHLCV